MSKPKEYTINQYELDSFKTSLRECINDTCCLDAWVDSLEYEVKNMISSQAYSAFRGFLSAMEHHLQEMKHLLDSKDFSLPL